MSVGPKPPPTAEEEAMWRARFATFAMLRVSGVVLTIVGLAIEFTPFLKADGWPLLGFPVAVVGLIDAIILPRVVRRQWEKP